MSERRILVALLLRQFTTAAASIGTVTILGKQVYDLSHRSLDLGLLGLAEFAPAALLVLVTGAIADRYDRVVVSVLATAAEAAAVAGLAWYASTEPTAIGPIFLLVVAFGVGRAFAAPSSRALPADLLAPERLPFAIPRLSVSWQAAAVVGPVLAGVLYTVSPAVALLGQAVLLLLGTLALALLPRLPSSRSPMPVVMPKLDAVLDAGSASGLEDAGTRGGVRATVSDALDGLRFVRSDPLLFGAISLDLFAVLFGGAVALLPALAEDRLGVGAVGLGWLRAATGIGAAVVTLSLAVRPVRHHVGRVLLMSVAVFGVFTVALGATRSYVVAFVALAALSGADAISVFIRSTLVPLATPATMRGRVLAVENVFIGASNELGAFESGVAAQLLGTSPAVVLGGVATVVIAGGWWILFPALRDTDEFPEGHRNEPETGRPATYP